MTMDVTSSGELEIRVQEIISAIQNGAFIEDDLIELKRELIDPRKAARRLAGHANQANGDYIVWIVGIDEATGEVHPITMSTDEWWAQVIAEFDDGVFPQLGRNRRVHLNEDESVLVLVFETDEAPYLVQTHDAGLDREVPLRSATAVRSARRHELLRIIGSAVRTPTSRVIWAEADLWNKGEQPEHVILRITVRLLFNPRTATDVLLLADGMAVHAAAYNADGETVWTDASKMPNLADPHEEGSEFAMANRLERIEDGAYLNGPSVAHVEAGFHVPESAPMEAADRIVLGVEIPVLEARPVKLRAELRGPEAGIKAPVRLHWGYPTPD